MSQSTILEQLCTRDEFTDKYQIIATTCVKEFLALKPEDVLHMIIDATSPHQERDLLSHTILALHALYRTDRFQTSTVDDKFRLTLAVLLHDVGKAIQWKNIDTSSGYWHFRGHDTVGACWFWALVKKNRWDEVFMRPIFLAIWYHMIKSPDNKGLLHFLRHHDALHLTECLHCADNYGRLEVQADLPETLLVDPIPNTSSVPNLPIVIYICGKSGAGKTTMARNIMESMSDVSVGYVSFDRTMLRVLDNITDPWADADPSIRGANIKAKSRYKTLYDTYQKDTRVRDQVRKGLNEDFKNSTESNTVTLFTSTTTKPSSHVLPFMSQRFLSIVTVPDRLDVQHTFFGSLRTSMEASRRGCGWSAHGPLLYVPEPELQSCIRHLITCRTMTLTPPIVNRTSELVPLLQYWQKTTGSLESMKYALESFYEVSVSIFQCAKQSKGVYYNFSYRDGAPYDDPFHPGAPSPAVFCRGTAFHYNNDVWTLARLPMNRGREIAFTPVAETEAEDAEIPTIFYSKLVKSAIADGDQLLTAKVDGALLIAFKDHHGLSVLPGLQNSQNIVFGTKGMVSMSPDIFETFSQALAVNGHTVETFSKICSEYMETNKLYSISFEMVATKRDELVVEYPKEQRGLYFLGGSRDDIFYPFFEFKDHPTSPPTTKKLSIQSASKILLGPFPEHVEGSVIWVCHNGLYYPLKLKTTMYYLLHKHRARPEYNDYLYDLVQEYGWHGVTKPTREQFDDNKLILTLFSLVCLPSQTLQMLPWLYRARTAYDLVSSLKGTSEELRANLSKDDYQNWCRFSNIYGNGRYDMAYELISSS